MQAIPTKYAGVQFRSRLEARWAAFFDLLEFPWQYEPFDCDGYIPDFLIRDRLLLEVKPITWGQPAHWQESGFEAAAQKLEMAFADHRFQFLAVVGIGIYLPNLRAGCGASNALIGRAAEWLDGAERWRWSDCHLDWWASNHEISIQGQPSIGTTRDTEPDFGALWHEAGNRVQWRGASSKATHGGSADFERILSPQEHLEGFREMRRILEEND